MKSNLGLVVDTITQNGKSMSRESIKKSLPQIDSLEIDSLIKEGIEDGILGAPKGLSGPITVRNK